jgi:hypothetical protein
VKNNAALVTGILSSIGSTKPDGTPWASHEVDSVIKAQERNNFDKRPLPRSKKNSRKIRGVMVQQE